MIFSIINKPNTANASSIALPKIVFVGVNQPALTGDKMQFSVLTKYDEPVQYKVFYHEPGDSRSIWKPLDPETNNKSLFTRVYRGDEPYYFYSMPLSKEGVYSFAIRVKRAGVKGAKSNSFGDYDYAYAFDVNTSENNSSCCSEVKGVKDIYETGEKIKIDSIDGKNIDDFEYKLNYFNLESYKLNNRSKNGWTSNATDYAEKLEYKGFDKPGTYVLDIWGRKKGSNNKYDIVIIKIIHVYSPNEELNVNVIY
jgi:hypothetical protein